MQPTWITQCPLLLLDTRMPYGSLSVGCEEHLDPAGTGSLYNEGEADIVVQHVLSLIYAGNILGNRNKLYILLYTLCYPKTQLYDELCLLKINILLKLCISYEKYSNFANYHLECTYYIYTFLSEGLKRNEPRDKRGVQNLSLSLDIYLYMAHWYYVHIDLGDEKRKI